MITPRKKILVVAPSWVGDTVMAQSLFKYIKQYVPEASIDVLASRFLHPLLQRMPEVNHCWTSPFQHGQWQLCTRHQLGKSLRQEGYHQAIVLPNSWKSAWVPYAAHIKQRTGWHGEMRWGLLNDKRSLIPQQFPLMVQRFVALGMPVPRALPTEKLKAFWPELVPDQLALGSTLQTLRISDPHPPCRILALCPGAQFGPSKRWPVHYFADVARYYDQQGWSIWIFGGPNEKELADSLLRLSGIDGVNLCGQTTLAQAIDMLSLAHVVISCDSGLMHLASALKRPLVVLYGSSSERFTPPLHDGVKCLSVDHLPCRPCFKRSCPLDHFRCMRDLKPTSVIEAVDQLTDVWVPHESLVC